MGAGFGSRPCFGERKMSLQEKFQITIPGKDDEVDAWVDQGSVRSTGEAGFIHSNNVYPDADVTNKTNFMPPGMDISNQRRKRIEQMPFSMSGMTDVSRDTSDGAFGKGFTRRNMGASDDQYTGEHVDHFYGEAVDSDGNVGFVERNNYLDRE